MQPNNNGDHAASRPEYGRRATPTKVARARELRKAMTPEERKLWVALRDRRLNGLRFRRQEVIGGFIADFYCHEARLVVEVDGGIHESQREYDAERDIVFAGYGLCVLRFTNDQVNRNFSQVLATIAASASAPQP